MYDRRRDGGGRSGGGGFGSRRFDDFDKPKPVKLGEEYDVKISDVGAKGDGITKIENFIIFVAGTKKGEECRIKIKEVSSRFAVGEKVGVSEDSGVAEEKAEETEQAESTEESEEKEEYVEMGEEEKEE